MPHFRDRIMPREDPSSQETTQMKSNTKYEVNSLKVSAVKIDRSVVLCQTCMHAAMQDDEIIAAQVLVRLLEVGNPNFSERVRERKR